MKKAAGILGLILTICFIVLGMTTTVPDKYIKSYGTGKMQEYVGGDAYNFIIEASLRGGEISGALTAKAIYFAAAGILAVLSVSFLKSDDRTDEIRSDIQSVQMDVKDGNSSLDKLVSNVSEQQGVFKNILTGLVERNVKEENETYSLHAEEVNVEKNTEENA